MTFASRLFITAVGIACFSAYSAHAQSWTIENTYGGDADDQAFDLVSHANGDVTHIGFSNSVGDPATRPNVHIVHSNPQGGPGWEFVHNITVATPLNSDVYQTEMSIFECANGDLVWTTGVIMQPGVKPDIIVMRLTPDGVPIWTSVLSSPNHGDDYSTSIIETDEEEIVIAGYTNDIPTAGGYDVIVARFDGAGTLLWSGRYGSAENDFARCIRETDLGLLTLIGELTTPANYDALHMGLTPSGGIVWSNRYNIGLNAEGFSTVMQNSNGDLYACGIVRNDTVADAWIVRTSAVDGSPIAGRRYDTGEHEGAWYIGRALTPDNLVVAGEMTDSFGSMGGDGFFMEVSPDLGTAINFRSYGTPDVTEDIHAVAFSPGSPGAWFTEGGYWLVGSSDAPSGGTESYDHYLVRSNLTGRTACAGSLVPEILPHLNAEPVAMSIQAFGFSFPYGLKFEQAATMNNQCPGVNMPPFARTGSEAETTKQNVRDYAGVRVYEDGDSGSGQYVIALPPIQPGVIQLALYDLQGRLLMRESHECRADKMNIDLSLGSMQAGAYLLHISGRGIAASLPLLLTD